MNDLEKLAEIWEQLRFNGHAHISLESSIWLMRTAAYAIATRHEPPARDERQAELNLRGGKWRPRVVTISVS